MYFHMNFELYRQCGIRCFCFVLQNNDWKLEMQLKQRIGVFHQKHKLEELDCKTKSFIIETDLQKLNNIRKLYKSPNPVPVPSVEKRPPVLCSRNKRIDNAIYSQSNELKFKSVCNETSTSTFLQFSSFRFIGLFNSDF